MTVKRCANRGSLRGETYDNPVSSSNLIREDATTIPRTGV